MMMSCIIHGLNMDPCVTLGRLRIRMQESYIRMDLREINVVCDSEMQHSGSEREF
jgi:hypothetical protein